MNSHIEEVILCLSSGDVLVYLLNTGVYLDRIMVSVQQQLEEYYFSGGWIDAVVWMAGKSLILGRLNSSGEWLNICRTDPDILGKGL